MRTVVTAVVTAGFLAALATPTAADALRDRERSGMFDILFAPGESATVPIGRDTVPPRVMRVEVVTHPDEPERRQVRDAGNVFVGIGTLEFRVTCSEPMARAPRVRLLQQGGFEQQAAMTAAAGDSQFLYRLFPVAAPQANGPATLEVTGRFSGAPDDFGTDRANNALVAFTQARAVLVDTQPPGLRRVDPRQPGQFRTNPAENQVLPAHGFPREIAAFVDDYNQPDDGSFGGGNGATDRASGVDFTRVGSGLGLRVLDPRGRALPGMVVVRPPSIVLMMPDPYNPSSGVFPDTDGDGRADPIEGNYRIEVEVVDRAGNRSGGSVTLGLDATPLGRSAVNVSIVPVFSEPFPNPPSPIPDRGAAVRRLDRVEIAGADADFDVSSSTARLLSRLGGPFTVPREMRSALTRDGAKLVLTVHRDQDGDGRDDFENPPPGVFLPPGTPDPRAGRNDGVYIVEVRARDRAGNGSLVTREFTLDTTPPRGEASIPGASVRVRGPLRIVDAFLDDPLAGNGNAGAGIAPVASGIRLDFRGNATHPAAPVRGIQFVHQPNPDDPTRPDFNPRDTRAKILFEILDASGRPASLPTDGSADGVYVMTVDVRDRAGNAATLVSSFEYTQAATMPLTVPLTLRSPR